jgi:hypothetical protein
MRSLGGHFQVQLPENFCGGALPIVALLPKNQCVVQISNDTRISRMRDIRMPEGVY